VQAGVAELQTRIAALRSAGGEGGSRATPTLADHLAEAGTPRQGDVEVLAAACAPLALRAARLRAEARDAEALYAAANAALELRMEQAQRSGMALADHEAEDALAAAAAADAADEAANQAEQHAVAMQEAARAAHLLEREGKRAGTVQARAQPREYVAGGIAARRREEEATAADLAEASAASQRVFRARPVPRSSREPRFERLLLDAELVREQRRAEAAARLRAREAPFSFWGRTPPTQAREGALPSRPQSRAGPSGAAHAASAQAASAEAELAAAVQRLRTSSARAHERITRMSLSSAQVA
jgi:hypothetical protein